LVHRNAKYVHQLKDHLFKTIIAWTHARTHAHTHMHTHTHICMYDRTCMVDELEHTQLTLKLKSWVWR